MSLKFLNLSAVSLLAPGGETVENEWNLLNCPLKRIICQDLETVSGI